MITSIPQMCIQYTQVFMTAKIEYVICIAAGMVIGIVAQRLHE